MSDQPAPAQTAHYDPREAEIHAAFAARLVDIEATYKPGLREMFEVLDEMEQREGARMRAAVRAYGGDFDERRLKECAALRRLLKLGEKIIANEAAVADALTPKRRRYG